MAHLMNRDVLAPESARHIKSAEYAPSTRPPARMLKELAGPRLVFRFHGLVCVMFEHRGSVVRVVADRLRLGATGLNDTTALEYLGVALEHHYTQDRAALRNVVERADGHRSAPRPESYLRPRALLRTMVELREKGDEAIDFVYDTLDELLLAGEIAQCNAVLRDAKPEDLGLQLTLAMLSITSGRDGLSERCSFAERAREFVHAKEPSRADSLLRGLT